MKILLKRSEILQNRYPINLQKNSLKTENLTLFETYQTLLWEGNDKLLIKIKMKKMWS